MESSIRVCIIEDNPDFRDVLALSLKQEASSLESIEAFGTVQSAMDTFSLRAENLPNIILLDLNLPMINGLEAIPLLIDQIPEVKIIVLTQSDAKQDVLSAIASGASGYLLKSSKIQQITEGIHAVYNGGASLDWNIGHYVVNQLQQTPSTVGDSLLSPRELEVLELLSKGLVKKEISENLGVSYGSVATYIRRLYEKLEVVNAAAAVCKGYQLGILKLDES